MLVDRRTLRQILTWLDPSKRPDLAIVLVDQDEVKHRKREIEGHVAGLPLMPVIGVAIQEFEAWLIADHARVAEILEIDITTPRNPEKMRRREAKQLLAEWIGKSDAELEGDEVRRRIAAGCDLSKVARRCRAFEAFRKAIATSVRTDT